VRPNKKSPIETRLRDAIRDQARSVPAHDLLLFDHTGDAHAVAAIDDGRVTAINSQQVIEPTDYGAGSTYCQLYRDVRIERYRADFLLWLDYGDTFVAIECDGHEWHERTKQQASADRARDRALLRLNVPALRFTGSDIFHDAESCAVEIIELAKLIADRSFASGHMHGWSDGHRSGSEKGETRQEVFEATRGIYAGILNGLG
jgi:very-short-patch-repair endonuclease